MATKRAVRPRLVRTAGRKAGGGNGLTSRNDFSDLVVLAGSTSIGQYLIERLYDSGVRHVFGVPGDYVLHFYEMLEHSELQVVGTTREDCAGFAADAYARMHGLGAVCVTYGVGGLNLCNSVAGAYAEKSPVVVISGAPGIAEQAKNPLLHHRVGSFTTQKEVFERITVASTVLEDRLTAFREIDRVLDEAMRHKRPVYIELPRDHVDALLLYNHRPALVELSSDRHTLAEALADVQQMVSSSKKPVILAGVEIHRFGLQDALIKLAEKTGIPMTSSLLGKSVVAENHPLFVGVYEGRMCRDEVREFVEESDCILMLGCFLTDIDMAGDLDRLNDDRCIYATSEDIRIRRHHYQNVLLADFLHGLLRTDLRAATRRPLPSGRGAGPSPPPTAARITLRRMIQRLNDFLDENMVVIADIGDSLFAASELVVHERTEFISPAYYTSMGFAVPGSLGASFACPELRPLVLVGDGAFQMTGTELTTIARYDLNPIVIVLNNRIYGTEQAILEGSFNALYEWQYHRMTDLLGKGWGCEVRTEQDFDAALKHARENTKSFSLLNVHLSESDRSPALERLAKGLGRRLS